MNIVRNPISLVVGFGLILMMGGCAHFHHGHSEQCKIHHKIHMAGEAQISAAQALQASSQKVQGTVVEVKLKEEDDHKAIWEVYTVTDDQKLMEVYVDAKTGEVLEVEEEKAE